MQVDARAFDRHRTFEHLTCLPLLLVPLLRTLHHVMVSLVTCAIVDEANLFAIDLEALGGRINAALLPNLRQGAAQGADAKPSLKLHLTDLLVA